MVECNGILPAIWGIWVCLNKITPPIGNFHRDNHDSSMDVAPYVQTNWGWELQEIVRIEFVGEYPKFGYGLCQPFLAWRQLIVGFTTLIIALSRSCRWNHFITWNYPISKLQLLSWLMITVNDQFYFINRRDLPSRRDFEGNWGKWILVIAPLFCFFGWNHFFDGMVGVNWRTVDQEQMRCTAFW